jgi:hypothetical protein
MPPDIDKDRSSSTFGVASQQKHVVSADDIQPKEDIIASSTAAAEDLPLECVFTSQRVRTDFSYLEQPVRAYLQPRSLGNKRLTCNNKGAVFLSELSSSSSPAVANQSNEFCLVPQPNGTILIQSVKQKNRFLCSDSKGAVYASETRHESMEDWTIQECRFGGGFFIVSAVTKRKLACVGNIIRALSEEEDHGAEFKPGLAWTIDFTSGELCFLSLPCKDQRLRCDLTGTLSLSPNYKGWEGWRISEAGNGLVRISPWAHGTHFLSCNDRGQVCTTETTRGPSELWTIEKAPLGSIGVVIQSAANFGRYLCFDTKKQILIATKHFQHFKESCIWQLESLHQSTHYLANIDCNRRLVGTAKHTVDSSRLPMKRECEEWKLQTTSQPGVVQLFSNRRQGYLTSDTSEQVGLTLQAQQEDESDKWIIEEHDSGNVLVSQLRKRVLVCNKQENNFIISTVPPPLTTTSGDVSPSALWRLDPKMPRQVTKEKMKAVGTAAALGVATTPVATPLVLGGVVLIIGITKVGVAGHVAVGSIRVAKALSTISRITFSSSQLVSHSQSSLLASSTKKMEGEPSRQARIGN